MYSQSSLWRTGNGGRDWNAISIPSRVRDDLLGIRAAHFSSMQEGWFQLSSQVFSTSNGGQSWNEQVLPISLQEQSGEVSSIFWSTLTDMLFVGGGEYKNVEKIEAASNDAVDKTGVKTRVLKAALFSKAFGSPKWNRVEVQVDLGYRISIVYFFDSKRGLCFGEKKGIWTADGGSTWTPIAGLENAAIEGRISSVYFLAPIVVQDLFALDRDNIWISSNAGLFRVRH